MEHGSPSRRVKKTEGEDIGKDGGVGGQILKEIGAEGREKRGRKGEK